MSLIIKKRQIILSALVLALGSAVFINWYFNKPEASAVGVQTDDVTQVSYSTIGDAQYVNASAASEQSSDLLSSSRVSRNKAHDEAFEKLNDVIKNPSASQSAVDAATKSLSQLTNVIKLEADIEALIQTKCGFESVVLINGETAEIACAPGSLDSTSILQIKEIMLKHTSVTPENITIFEAKS